MQANHFQKPENVLKKAEEIIGVGQKDSAIELLYGFLQSRRHRQWSKVHEQAMYRFLELCVELRDGNTAKQGLFSYRSISQHQAPNSLGKVIEHMLSLAEQRVKDAGARVEVRTAASNVKDLENDTTPETVLLATVTSSGARERNEREYLVPWLKFLWESYRIVLDLLKNNPDMEMFYHKTAHRAFQFCREYERKEEFRRLAHLLREHLEKQHKFARDEAGNLAADTMELHLTTRFEQLRVASALHLWYEGFRTIEDIHLIMTSSTRKPSSQLMATYYQKLTQMFLISQSFLFHAYSYKAFYFLSKERNKALTKENAQVMASGVLLAALSIPLQGAGKAGTTYSEADVERDKNRRMAQLLGFDINPKRERLIEELISNQILQHVLPEVQKLYYLLESGFDPLGLVKASLPLIHGLKQKKELQAYAEPLQRLLIVRLLAQLSKVYYTVRLDDFHDLLDGIDMSRLDTEKVVLKAIKARQIDAHGIQIDHKNECIRFGEDILEEDRTRTLLTDLATGLQGISAQLKSKDDVKKRKNEKEQVTRRALAQLSEEHRLLLSRKRIIEQRKQEFEDLQAAIVRQERERQTQIQLERERKEQERVQLLQKAKQQREEEKRKRHEKLLLEKQRQAIEGEDSSGMDGMSMEERAKKLEEKKKAAQKEAIKIDKKVYTQAKKMDIFIRALREKEVPKIKKQIEEEKVEAEKRFHSSLKDGAKNAREEHKKALARKAELGPIQDFRTDFEETLAPIWSTQLEKERQRLLKLIETRKRFNKMQRAEQRRVEAEQRRVREREQERIRELEAERIRQEEERAAERERVNERESSSSSSSNQSTHEDRSGDGSSTSESRDYSSAYPRESGAPKYQPPRRNAEQGEARDKPLAAPTFQRKGKSLAELAATEGVESGGAEEPRRYRPRHLREGGSGPESTTAGASASSSGFDSSSAGGRPSPFGGRRQGHDERPNVFGRRPETQESEQGSTRDKDHERERERERDIPFRRREERKEGSTGSKWR